MSHAQTGVKALSPLRPLQSMAASLCLSALLLGCTEPPLDCDINPNIVDLTTDTSPIHDPAMIKAEDVYYLYSSSNFGAFYSSKDMRKWQLEGAVFNEIPPWLVEKIPVADHIGAPDITYYNGRYLLFYQSHNPNTCDAATGLTINQTLNPADPDYEWVDQGLILRSEPFYEGVEIYCGNEKATFNAIDAHFFQDSDGKPWMVFGSTIGGIKIVALDPQTLQLADEHEFITLAQRWLLQDDPIIEAPYIVQRHGYYYLFMSFNHCCLEEKTQYQVRVGRAEKVTGPYYDKSGWPLYLGGGSLVIDRVTDKDGDFIGTGHNNVFAENGQDWLVHHAKKPAEDYKAYLNIRKLDWEEDSWPTVCTKN
jgi:arabinan endo-1,5-alpha-L-arabinosidase